MQPDIYFFCLEVDRNIHRCSLLDFLAGVRAVVQTGRNLGVDGGRGRVELGAGASSAAAQSHCQKRQQGEGSNRWKGGAFPIMLSVCLSDRCVCCRTGGSMWTRCISTETESRLPSWRPRWVSQRPDCVGGWVASPACCVVEVTIAAGPCPQSYLDKLQEDIGKTLEKVGSREKYINNQLGHLIQEYRSAQAKLSEVPAAPSVCCSRLPLRSNPRSLSGKGAPPAGQWGSDGQDSSPG